MASGTGTSQEMRSSLLAYTTCLWAMILLVGPKSTSAHSRHFSSQPVFFQLPDEPTGEAMSGKVVAGDGSHPKRLLELLSVQDSMNKLMHPDLAQPGSVSGESSVGPSALNSGVSDGGEALSGLPDAPLANKRVFCNGFTGCGGRFREQRRQGPARKSKRVFCNSQGCFNGGRKRNNSKAAAENVNVVRSESAGVNMDLWEEALRRLAEFERTRLRKMSKRLFCNGYGGCQNNGKRSSQSKRARDSGADVKLALPRLEIFRERQLPRGKRFFVGGADMAFDAINDAL